VADPSRATIQTEWANAIKVLDETYKYGSKNATNLLGLLDTLTLSYAGDWIDDASGTAEAVRAAIAGAVSGQTAATFFRPFLKQYCKSVINRTDLQSDSQMLDAMYDYFMDNSLRVQSRVFSYGNPAAGGSNVGTMQILRLNRDKRNQFLEGQHADAKKAACTLDYNTGTSYGAESYYLQGQAPERDELKRSGSGLNTVLSAKTADDSLLENASWSNFDDASTPTTMGGWSSSAGISSSIMTFSSTTYFRPAPSDGSTAYSIALAASTNLTQTLSTAGATLNQDIPYLLAVIWNRAAGSASGTLTCRLGSQGIPITVAAQTGWTVSLVPASIPNGQGCWYRNFAQADVTVSLQWARTSGTLYIDDVLLVPGLPFDGGWYWAIPSSTSAYVAGRVGDSFTWTDTASDASAAIQKWFAWAYNRSMPSANGSSITWAQV
jgi:hypothetical protein